MEILLTAASVAASSARSLLSKRLSGASATVSGFGRVNALMSLCALTVIGIYAALTGVPGISPLTLILALCYALFTMAAQLFYMRALAEGEVSAVTFFYSCGFLIPTFAGAILFREELTVWRLFGVFVLIGAFKLISTGASGARRASGRGWIACALLAMASSGAVGLIQKLHQSSAHREELGGFLIIAFTVCTLLSLALASRAKAVEKVPLWPTIFCGVCIGAANIINTRLSGMLPAMSFSRRSTAVR